MRRTLGVPMGFVIAVFALVAGVACTIGVLSGKPWLVAGVMAAVASPLLLIISPLGPIGAGLFVLIAVSAMGGAIIARIVLALRARISGQSSET